MQTFSFLFIVAMILSLQLQAQNEQDQSKKLLEEYKSKFLNDPFKLKQKKITPPKINFSHKPSEVDVPEYLPEDPSVIKLPLKGKYVGQNGKGDEIYVMEPDNMPCLVPGKTFNSNMPVKEYKQNKNQQNLADKFNKESKE